MVKKDYFTSTRQLLDELALFHIIVILDLLLIVKILEFGGTAIELKAGDIQGERLLLPTDVLYLKLLPP
jgi:hypothetical protein